MPKNRILTPRQREVFRCIEEFIEEKGYPPVLRELGDRLGISEKATYDHLHCLSRKGYISRDPLTPRGIKIRKPSPRVFIAKCADAERGIEKGDYLYVCNGKIVSITRDLQGV